MGSFLGFRQLTIHGGSFLMEGFSLNTANRTVPTSFVSAEMIRDEHSPGYTAETVTRTPVGKVAGWEDEISVAFCRGCPST